MFSDLQNKIATDKAKKRPSDSQSIRSSVAGNMMGSSDSLTSLNSATTNRKSDRIKYLESKIVELSDLLRQKNASAEASVNEINGLKAKLLQANNRASTLLMESSPDQIEEEVKSVEIPSNLGSMLSKAEANLAAVDRLSEEVIAQKDERNRKVIQELEFVKFNLTKSEAEVKALNSQLAEKVAEIEDLSRQLTQRTSELEAAKEMHSKMLDDQRVKAEAEKEAIEKKVTELTNDLILLKIALSQQEHETVKALDRAQSAQAETEKATSQLRRSTLVIANERVADLKDRVRLLEERLVLLTEPDSAFFDEHMEEVKLSSGPLPDADSPEAVSARCVTLLVERKLLESRLMETRRHLEEVKSAWNEGRVSLESQVTHLNEKIAADSSDRASEKAEWEMERQKLESELTEMRNRQAVTLAEVGLQRAECERCREWEAVRVSLEDEIVVLKLTAETNSHAHAEALQHLETLQSRISTLEKEIEHGVTVTDSLKREKDDLKTLLDAKNISKLEETISLHKTSAEQNAIKMEQLEYEIQRLRETNDGIRSEMDHLRQTLEDSRKASHDQVIALNEKLARSAEELQASVKQIADAQDAANTAQRNCQQLQLERDALHAKLTELEEVFEKRLAEVQKEHKEKEQAQTSAEVTALQASIDELNEAISDRNKTIRLQKQKLSDLKKVLGHGLRPVTKSNLSLPSADEEFPNHHSLSSYSGSAVLAEASTNDVTQGGVINAVPPPPPPPPPSPLAILPSTEGMQIYAPTLSSALSPATFSTADSHQNDYIVNFEYLRHVLLKFLLSHDSEALQLVRAVVTIMRFSKKEEFLIRQRLEERRSWFSTPVVSPKNSGQFADVIPH